MFENNVKDEKLSNHFKQYSIDKGCLPTLILSSLSMDLTGKWTVHYPICTE